jgi:hypothetical protein
VAIIDGPPQTPQDFVVDIEDLQSACSFMRRPAAANHICVEPRADLSLSAFFAQEMKEGLLAAGEERTTVKRSCSDRARAKLCHQRELDCRCLRARPD